MLPVQNLLALRGTFFVWNQSTLSEIKNKHDPIQLKSSNVEELTQLLQSRTENPFVSYTICKDDLARNLPNFEEFFTSLGKSIQRLNIVTCPVPTESTDPSP